MEKRSTARSLIAGLLLAAMILAAPLVLTESYGAAIPDTSVSTLEFDGVRLALDAEGNLQALIDVWVKYQPLTYGVEFTLQYNPNWLLPSDYETNEVLPDTGGLAEIREQAGVHNNFFVVNEDLLVKTYDNGTVVKVNPFAQQQKRYGILNGNEVYYRMLDKSASSHQMQFTIYLDRERLITEFAGAAAENADYTISGNVHRSRQYIGEKNSNNFAQEEFFYLSSADEDTAPYNEVRANTSVKIGTLSFRITDRDALREMVEKYGSASSNKRFWFDPVSSTDAVAMKTYDPIYGVKAVMEGGWYILAYQQIANDMFYTDSHAIPSQGAAVFKYDFGHGLITARLLREEVTINAYRAYSVEGTNRAAAYANVAAALQKYSPTVVATYADAHLKNFTLHWGATDTAECQYEYRVYYKRMSAPAYNASQEEKDAYDALRATALTDPRYLIHTDNDVEAIWEVLPSNYVYDPRGGEYIATQYFYYNVAEPGNPAQYERYPNKLMAHLTITPVTVTGVLADDLDHTYTYNAAVAKSGTDTLGMPGDARILTDVVSGSPGLYLEIGGVSAAHNLPAWAPAESDMSKLHRDDWDGTDMDDHWPTDDTKTKGAGVYSFTLGSAADNPGSLVHREEIRAKYPWLTANNDYPLVVTRTVLDKGQSQMTYLVKHVTTDYVSYSSMASGGAAAITDYTDDGLRLELAVAAEDDHKFGENAAFRVRMPNGNIIGLDANSGGVGDWFNDNNDPIKPQPGPDKERYDTLDRDEFQIFGNTNRSNSTLLKISPGITGAYATGGRNAVDGRAELRTMINLGGYFEISICEDARTDDGAGNTLTPKWSEFYPVYVPPRDNLYEEDKAYNFIGLNAELIDYRGLNKDTVIYSDTITVPNGEYYPLDIATNTLNATAEDYGILTTYDGKTGEQPGRAYTFKVLHSSSGIHGLWDIKSPETGLVFPVAGVDVTKYNALGNNDFDKDSYNGGGIISNYQTTATTAKDFRNELFEPVIRFQEYDDPVDAPLESLLLVYEGVPTLNVIEDNDPNNDGIKEVEEVVFDTQTEGYIVRQSFVLTLYNNGTSDIDGLFIDALTDIDQPNYNKDETNGSIGGHFEITDPPASYLPAGAKTTFTVTYVRALEPLQQGNSELGEYLDKLYVCSNRSGVTKYLKEFDARFVVTPNQVNRVTVVVLPPFLDKDNNEFFLGEAGVIEGPYQDYTDGNKWKMNFTYGSTMRTANEQVYIGTFPYDEYEVEVVLKLESGALRVLDTDRTEPGSSTTAEWSDDGVYSFKMPPQNVTIYVIFDEPVSSKLRPADLDVYASDSAVKTADRTQRDATRKTMWQKDLASEYGKGGIGADLSTHLELMMGGAAAADGYNSSKSHYLVVLERDEAYVQTEAILRKVIAISDHNADPSDHARAALAAIGYDKWNDYENLDLTGINVEMALYTPIDETAAYGDGSDYWNVTPLYNSAGDIGDDKGHGATTNHTMGSTASTTTHTSIVFDAPAIGHREWVVVTLQYSEGGNETQRHYYIELVRRPSHSVVMNYGNSPVGMIYNTKAYRVDDGGNIMRGLNDDGKALRERFVKNRNFVGVATGSLPYAMQGNDKISKVLTYNREAWVPQGMLYDPDSLTSVDTYYVGGSRTDPTKRYTIDDCFVTVGTPPDEEQVRDFSMVTDYNDLDLDPFSLFVLLGEDFTDPGLESIHDSSMRTVEPERVRRYIKDAVLIDTTKTTQIERFDGVMDENGVVTVIDVDLGTLANGSELDWDFWRATHNYVQQMYELSEDGMFYPSFYDPTIPTASDPTVEDKDTDGRYFLYKGSYRKYGSPFDPLNDQTIIDRLVPWVVDTPTSISIRPGVYELVYEFDDFDSVVDTGREPLTETRYIVVLGRVGDVDADSFVENDFTFADKMRDTYPGEKPQGDDEGLLEGRVADQLGYNSKVRNTRSSNVVKFRTADVNNDRNVNNIDANLLRKSAAAGQSIATKVLQFYEPYNFIDPTLNVTTRGGTR